VPSRVLLIGHTGQLGRRLRRTLATIGPLHCPSRAELDLADIASIRRTVREVQPGLIVNAAAYTAVDRAESEEAIARVANATAPEVLAEEARRAGAIVVHFSTDYVFDGRSDRPYVELDPPSPINAYGRTKLAGERAVLDSGARAIVFRIGWVYDCEGRNFLTTIRRLAGERGSIEVVGDQVGVPTWSGTIAQEVARVAVRTLRAKEGDGWAPGLYHLSGSGHASWAQFAAEILQQWPVPGREHVRVAAIPSTSYPTPAARPAYTVMDSARMRGMFGVSLPDWREQLRGCLAERSSAT
jgi:dTDP-4-dehydrorhamnose reductase